MHAKHRSPATAYNRSSSMGMGGMGTTSRISPEGSMRSRGMYNSEYKNYNRGGYGRGQLRQFEPQQPSSQKSDIFMEAGRMAAEYLVSKGLLPQSALLGKLQNGSLKNHVGYSQGFRMLDGDNMQLPMEGRTSALSRLGNAADGEGPGRKRYPNDYSSMASKGYVRGRRRHGSYKDSEWDQEFGRSATWSDRARASTDMDGHTYAFSGHQDEKQAVKDSNSELQNSPAAELNPETDGIRKLVGDSESILNRNQSAEDTSAIDTGKDLPLSDKVDQTEKSDDMETSNAEVGEVENGNDNDGMEATAVKEDKQINLCAEKDNLTSKKGNDLLSLCRFEKVPTRIRSSLATRCPKVGVDTMAEEEETLESGLPKEFDAQGEDMSMHVSSDDISLHQNHDTKALDSENSKALATEEVPCVSFAIIEENTTGASSFADHPLIKEDEESEGVHMFGRCSSIERGKKRSLEDIDDNEGIKKPRELVLSDETEPDVFVYSNSMTKQQNSHDQNTTNGEPAMLSPEHKKLVDVSLFSSDVVPTTEFSEKQLFPSSYKTCDLNRIETCDVNLNCDADSVLMLPCTKESGKQTAPVDIGLSMNENYDLTNKYSKCGFGGRDIEVIDLENDSEQDNKTFNNPQSSETEFTAQDGFPNDANNANDIADAQDGYGLMLSELLGNDIPNCSSVPGDLNPLHNDMGLHNGEGMLGDDDSIYMSLGEIPISFLGAWQQPSQEFGKPF